MGTTSTKRIPPSGARAPPPGTCTHNIEYINHAPLNQAPLALDTPNEIYVALGQFEHMLDDPVVRFDYHLLEGDAVLFDNRRVMHARTAVSERDEEGLGEETNRWLKGRYLEADSVLDGGGVLRDEPQRTRRQAATFHYTASFF